MRFVVARRRGRRGEGLGNECFSWAKGWLASQVLNARQIGPSWGWNARRYYRNFRTSRLDFLVEEALLRLPHHTFTEQDYIHSGKLDFGAAVGSWAEAKGLRRSGPCIVSVDGMYGGYPAIHEARPFLLAKLLNSRDALRNIHQVSATLDRRKLFVAVHMRFGGDFAAVEVEKLRGKFNVLVPDDWYLWVCAALQDRFGDRIQFHFFTDRGGTGFEEAIRCFNPGQIRQPGLTECSDLLLMAQADLRVCSISSYSLMASFLGGGPYLWYEPQLTLEDEGLYSLWGKEPYQQQPESPTTLSRRFALSSEAAGSRHLGSAMRTGDPVPGELLQMLEERLDLLRRETNLLEYGCLPARRETPI